MVVVSAECYPVAQKGIFKRYPANHYGLYRWLCVYYRNDGHPDFKLLPDA